MSEQEALTVLFKQHTFARMECFDHDGRCCPEGGCHDIPRSTTQYQHYADVVIAATPTPPPPPQDVAETSAADGASGDE